VLLVQNLPRGVDLTRCEEPDPLAGRAREDLGVQPAKDAFADTQGLGCLADGEQPILVGYWLLVVPLPRSTQAPDAGMGAWTAAWSTSQSVQKWLPVNAVAQVAWAPLRPPRLPP
jgi:hypothetical protein